IDENDEHLVQGDVRFEPRSALVAPQNGLADLAEIAAQSAHYLTLGGWLIVEHGWRQGDAVRELFRENGFYRVETRRDYGGNDRVTLGQREEK
ncbi:protein-(glutamine-N5) methyltransferase, release factor-specific, partial [Klebsiella pneumoniae]|nr:protein-(glutamine-N5) methyltransferase, release factor-specific [Klebsiella pneumoniae]